MKKKQLIIQNNLGCNLKKWLATLTMFCLMLLMQRAYAQCQYVSVNGNDTFSRYIPNDFPVYVSTGEKKTDDAIYSSHLTLWLSQNPSISLAYFGPNSVNSFIKIPRSIYDTFDIVRKQSINAMPQYYFVSNH